jgi:hypothetical protein
MPKRKKPRREANVPPESELLPVREFPDRGLQWLLDTPDNVRAVMRILAPFLAEQMDFSRLQRVRARLMWFLMLLIYHRRAPAEHRPLADIVTGAAREHRREEEIANMSNTIAEELIREGEARGRAQAMLQAKCETLLRLLRRKFVDVPAEVASRVQGLSVADLDRLLDRILDATSLADLGLDGATA